MYIYTGLRGGALDSELDVDLTGDPVGFDVTEREAERGLALYRHLMQRARLLIGQVQGRPLTRHELPRERGLARARRLSRGRLSLRRARLVLSARLLREPVA